MACYEIQFKSSAERELHGIDRQYIPRILESIEALRQVPFPPQARKLVDTESCYRIRVGNYRVIYEVDTKEKIVIIEHIRHRREAYKNL